MLIGSSKHSPYSWLKARYEIIHLAPSTTTKEAGKLERGKLGR